MTKKERQIWLKLIDECLKQFEYGKIKKCSLCVHVGFDLKDSPHCGECIVVPYGKDVYGTTIPSCYQNFMPCIQITHNEVHESVSKNIPNYYRAWSVTNTRMHLRRLRKWVEKQ